MTHVNVYEGKRRLWKTLIEEKVLKNNYGECGVRTRGFSHAKRARYHCVNSPTTCCIRCERKRGKCCSIWGVEKIQRESRGSTAYTACVCMYRVWKNDNISINLSQRWRRGATVVPLCHPRHVNCPDSTEPFDDEDAYSYSVLFYLWRDPQIITVPFFENARAR